MDVLERIDQQVKGNAIVIFMKGTPQFPHALCQIRPLCLKHYLHLLNITGRKKAKVL